MQFSVLPPTASSALAWNWAETILLTCERMQTSLTRSRTWWTAHSSTLASRCCGIGRIYVHEALYGRFVEAFVDLTNQYRLGNPLEADTTLGPMVRTQAADSIRRSIAQAIHAGARP